MNFVKRGLTVSNVGLCLMLVASTTPYWCRAEESATGSGQPKNIKIEVEGEELRVGDAPFMLSSYDSSGKTAGTGMFSLSQEFKDTIMDVSAIPTKYEWQPTLGVQLNEDKKPVIAAALRRRMCQKAYFNQESVVFADTNRTVDAKGPSITIKLRSPSGNDIETAGLTLECKTVAGKKLETSATKDDLFTIYDVPRETLVLTLSSADRPSGWTEKLYPLYRSAQHGLVVYCALKVPIGKEKPE